MARASVLHTEGPPFEPERVDHIAGYSSGELVWLITRIKARFDSRPCHHNAAVAQLARAAAL